MGCGRRLSWARHVPLNSVMDKRNQIERRFTGRQRNVFIAIINSNVRPETVALLSLGKDKYVPICSTSQVYVYGVQLPLKITV